MTKYCFSSKEWKHQTEEFCNVCSNTKQICSSWTWFVINLGMCRFGSPVRLSVCSRDNWNSCLSDEGFPEVSIKVYFFIVVVVYGHNHYNKLLLFKLWKSKERVNYQKKIKNLYFCVKIIYIHFYTNYDCPTFIFTTKKLLCLKLFFLKLACC